MKLKKTHLRKTLGAIAFALTLGMTGAASAHDYHHVNTGMPFFNLSIFSSEPRHHYHHAPRPVLVRNYYYEDRYYGRHDKHHGKKHHRHDDRRGRGHGRH